MYSEGVAAVTGNVFMVSPYSSNCSVEFVPFCLVVTTGRFAGPTGVVELKVVSTEDDFVFRRAAEGCPGGLVTMAVVANVSVLVWEQVRMVRLLVLVLVWVTLNRRVLRCIVTRYRCGVRFPLARLA